MWRPDFSINDDLIYMLCNQLLQKKVNRSHYGYKTVNTTSANKHQALIKLEVNIKTFKAALLQEVEVIL